MRAVSNRDDGGGRLAMSSLSMLVLLLLGYLSISCDSKHDSVFAISPNPASPGDFVTVSWHLQHGSKNVQVKIIGPDFTQKRYGPVGSDVFQPQSLGTGLYTWISIDDDNNKVEGTVQLTVQSRATPTAVRSQRS